MILNMTKVLLREATRAQAKTLVGFDRDGDIFHVLLFDFGEDGGAIGVWREGDDFCARVSLDTLAEFYVAAKAEHEPPGEC